MPATDSIQIDMEFVHYRVKRVDHYVYKVRSLHRVVTLFLLSARLNVNFGEKIKRGKFKNKFLSISC